MLVCTLRAGHTLLLNQTDGLQRPCLCWGSRAAKPLGGLQGEALICQTSGGVTGDGMHIANASSSQWL